MVTTLTVKGEQAIRLGTETLVASKSQPGGWYKVGRDAHGKMVCQCKGWSFRGHCRHIDAVELLDWQARALAEAEKTVQRAAVLTRASDLYD